MEDQTEQACLLLHGFTGGPYEIEPLAESLDQAGWSCRVPVLPGHDGPLQDLRTVKYTDWLEAVCREAEELTRTRGSFDLVGFSMGGMLALHLAVRYPVRRLVLLNAAAIYASPRRFVREWVQQRRSGCKTARHKIHETPLRAALEFIKLVRFVRPDLRKVTAPTLILQGLQDPVIHPYSARYIYGRLSGERKVCYLPHSRHLLCLDSEADLVIETVRQFLSK